MTGSPIALVQTTLPDLPAAERIARALIETHDAACVQLIPVGSVFRWEGQIEEAREFRLEIKTTLGRLDILIPEIERLHPYDVPEILVIRSVETSQRYGDWVKSEVGAG